MSASKGVKAAVCQLQIGVEKQENLRAAEAMLREAQAKGAELAVLPEMFVCPYQPDMIIAAAEPEDGPTARRLMALAAELELLLIAGSIAERGADGALYNTSLIVAPDGALLSRYRKNHLFDVEIPGLLSARESAAITPGKGLEAVRWQGWSLAVNICFDIRFPAMAQAAARQGAHILAVPAQFSAATGEHWELLLRARALDHQLFVLGANAAYNAQAEYQSRGGSVIVDPWGTVLGRAGSGPELIMAELDFARLEQVRQILPVAANRRGLEPEA